MHSDILEFIYRRWSMTDADWFNGNCYWFAHILVTRFDILDIYYLPIEGHFIAGDGDIFYDASGLVNLKEQPQRFEDIRNQDASFYERLIRDCVQ